MIESRYRYTAVAIDRHSERLGELRLDPVFDAAVECAYLTAVRKSKLEARTRHEPARVEPRWDVHRGEPYVEGLQVRFATPDGGVFTSHVPRSYFTPAVEAAAATLVSAGKLQPGETFTYTDLTAFPAPEQDRHAGAGFQVEELSQPLTTVAGRLSDFLAQSESRGPHVDTDIPVFIHAHVLDEAIALARAAGRVEAGGVLIGHARRDGSLPELFLEATAQIEARHTLAGETRLNFTQDTWAAASRAIALRRRGEIMFGWWHSHPHFCAGCPPERKRVCSLSSPFFSLDDRALHAAVFGRGVDIALLITDTGTNHLSTNVYGWRDGAIAERGFYTMQPEETSHGH